MNEIFGNAANSLKKIWQRCEDMRVNFYLSSEIRVKCEFFVNRKNVEENIQTNRYHPLKIAPW